MSIISILLRRRSLDVALEWFRLHRRSRSEILLAFDDYAFTGIESTMDDPHGVSALSDLHGAHADAVVLIDNSNEIAALLLVDGGLGDEFGVLLLPDHGADLAVLPGAQQVTGIRKQSGELDGAGVRIHLAISE